MSVTHSNSQPGDLGPRFQVQTCIASTATFASLTAALQDNAGTTGAHAHADLKGISFYRVVGFVATTDDAASGPEVRAQYSIDGGSNWSYFTAAAGTGKSVFTGATHESSAWQPVPAAAQRNDVVVRVVGFGGDAGGSPVIKQLGVEFSA